MNSSNATPARDDDGAPAAAFPEGGYLVSALASLRRQRLIEKVWLGREIVARRDDEGTVCVAEGYCAHLGSRLGPGVGGSVKRSCLVHPFARPATRHASVTA